MHPGNPRINIYRTLAPRQALDGAVCGHFLTAAEEAGAAVDQTASLSKSACWSPNTQDDSVWRGGGLWEVIRAGRGRAGGASMGLEPSEGEAENAPARSLSWAHREGPP